MYMESIAQKLELLNIQLPAFRLKCGVPTYAYYITHVLQPIQKNHDVSLEVIIDFPWGYALKSMSTEGKSPFTVILTDNPCCEYWTDLWGQNPSILLAGGHGFTQLAISMCDAVVGKKYKKIPPIESKLSKNEQAILSIAAHGKSNKEIALQLGISEYTVRNYLNQIFMKLEVSTRVEVGFYYWGLWHLLSTNSHSG
jgi:DNA-binding CsgD family transcriptional regulator